VTRVSNKIDTHRAYHVDITQVPLLKISLIIYMSKKT